MHYTEPILRAPRELLILRHAKSDRDGDAETDFARPLAKRGKKDAQRMGAWMYREGLVPDLVVGSPAERARQTTNAVCKGLEYPRKAVVWNETIYQATVADLLGVLARLPASAKTVLLAHLWQFLPPICPETPPFRSGGAGGSNRVSHLAVSGSA